MEIIHCKKHCKKSKATRDDSRDMRLGEGLQEKVVSRLRPEGEKKEQLLTSQERIPQAKGSSLEEAA